VPFPDGTLLDRSGFRSTGWAACDVIPGGAYLDNELLEFVGDLAAVAVAVDWAVYGRALSPLQLAGVALIGAALWTLRREG